MLSSCYLKSIFSYDRTSGILTWKNRTDCEKRWNTRWAGKKAGYFDSSTGYYKVLINKKQYYLHKIISIINEIESEEVDHIDLDKKNNSIFNLRGCTKSENLCNREKPKHNTSGHKNIGYVLLNKRKDCQIRAIIIKNKIRYSKIFENTEDGMSKAKEWCENKRIELHKEFKRS